MSEKLLQEAFCAWLRTEGLPFFVQRMDKAATGTKGWPDITVVENNRVLLIEMKFGKGRLSTDQVFRHAELARAGCRVHVVRDIAAAIELVQAWRTQAPDVPVPGEKLVQFAGKQWRRLPNGFLEKVSA